MCICMSNHIKLVHMSGVLIVQINSITSSMQLIILLRCMNLTKFIVRLHPNKPILS